MKEPLQILVILDVAQVAAEEVLPLLPQQQRNPEVLRLSAESGRQPMGPGAMRGPYDWDGLSQEVESLADKVRRASKEAEGTAVLYVAGRAPLPLFVQLGYSLSKHGTKTVVLNPHRGGPWMAYPMGAVPGNDEPRFFDVVKGLGDENSPGHRTMAGGTIPVFVSTIGAPAPEEDFVVALRLRRRFSAGTVEIRTSGAGDVSPQNMGRIANELARELPRIPNTFPIAEGLALFVAGPVPLAFAVGRSLNFRTQRDILVMNYDRGGPGSVPGYEVAVTLPLPEKSAHAPRDTAEDKLARKDVLEAMIEGIDELRTTLRKEDFPPTEVPSLSHRYLGFLRDLRFPREPEGDAFTLSISQRELRIGRRLLEAVRNTDRNVVKRFAQLLLLHELYHDGQDLRTSNYAEIGRAGVVLEEVDFWADAFALATLIVWDLRQSGPRAQADPMRLATEWIDSALFGIEVFDRFEHGERIARLHERRLRRYLIWHLQRERVKTVRGADDIRELLRDRLFVELAPLESTLDARGDKLVTRAISGRSEIFAVLKGRLVRRGPRPDFDPSVLVDAVREFRKDEIQRVMGVLVEEHRLVLASWTEQ